MSPFMKYHWRPPPHKYDIIYMEKVRSCFYLGCVVLNLWNWFFFSPDVSGLLVVMFPGDNVCPMGGWSPWLRWPIQLQQKKEKIDHNKSRHDKAEMKWKITSLVCGFDLPVYNGTGFPPTLGTPVDTSEIVYICFKDPTSAKAPELCSLSSLHCTLPLPQRTYGRFFWFIRCIWELPA